MPTRYCDRPVTIISVNGAALLSSTLTDDIAHAFEHAEDLGPSTIALIHVVGCLQPSGLKTWPGPVDLQTVNKWERVLRRIERAELTTLAVLEHHCTRLALELLLVVDRRIASKSFSMTGKEPEVDIWPSMALYRLGRQLGESRARQFVLDSTTLTAERGVDLGIIDIVSRDVGPSLQQTFTQFLQHAPPRDYPISRRLLHDCVAPSFEEMLGSHLAACDRALRRSLSYECTTL
jgi:isomerase DpgB